MKRGRLLSLLLAAALVALFGVRAVSSWIRGPAYARGRVLAAGGYYDQALPLLERGTLGLKSSATLWLRGQVRVGLWQYGIRDGREPEELRAYLTDAHREYTRAIAMSPASGWYWASLGELYHQVERMQRYREGLMLDQFDQGGWARVGRPGRLAIGMTRMAIEREPTVFLFHDQLAITLWEYRLFEHALKAVQQSARVQPVYRFHAYENLAPVPETLIDAFTDASRDALGRTPFLRRTLHLLALGRLEYRRGNLEQAEQDLRAALEVPGELLNRAEGHYYLGLVLTGRERYDEAAKQLVQAESHPNFEASAVAARARIAEAQARIDEALELLRRARRLEPRRLFYVLEYARMAREVGEWKKAEEALRWGTTIEPGSPHPWKGLATIYLRMGRLPDARRALQELERIEGDTDSTRRLRGALEHAGAS